MTSLNANEEERSADFSDLPFSYHFLIILYSATANSESINGNTDMIDNEIPHETLDNIIIEAINTIGRKKRPDANSIFGYLNKKNSNILPPFLIPD